MFFPISWWGSEPGGVSPTNQSLYNYTHGGAQPVSDLPVSGAQGLSGWPSCSELSALSLWPGLANASQLAQPFALLLASGAPVAFGPSFLASPSGLELEICSPGEVQAIPYMGHRWGQRLCQPPGQGPMEPVTLPGMTRSTGSHHPGARGCGCSGLLCSAMLLVQALHSTDGETESKGGKQLIQDCSRAGPGTRCADATPGLVLPLPAQFHKYAESHAAPAAPEHSSSTPHAGRERCRGRWVGPVNFPGGKAVRWVRPGSAHRPPGAWAETRKMAFPAEASDRLRGRDRDPKGQRSPGTVRILCGMVGTLKSWLPLVPAPRGNVPGALVALKASISQDGC